MSATYEVIHVIADISPQSGGTSRVVVELTDALSKHGDVQPILVSQSLIGSAILPSLDSCVQRHIAKSNSRIKLNFGLPLRNVLRSIVEGNRICLIHNHGLWLPVNYWAARLARQKLIPTIIQPHGMLEPRALRYRKLKKHIALDLFQRRDLETAKVLVATSAEECENIRQLGFRQPIAVISNGVKLHQARGVKDFSDFRTSGTRTVLFLSRIHPIKGLENLLYAWAKILPSGWRLKIAGPNEGGHLRTILWLVRELGLEQMVDYVGLVEGDEKAALYRNADLFVLPTFSENFGVVVAEALSYGLPVITTRGAPWMDLETYRCGWWIDIGVEPLAQALREAMSLSDEERRTMGLRGREYVQRYDWDGIAGQMSDVYHWVLGQGFMPDCVRLD